MYENTYFVADTEFPSYNYRLSNRKRRFIGGWNFMYLLTWLIKKVN